MRYGRAAGAASARSAVPLGMVWMSPVPPRGRAVGSREVPPVRRGCSPAHSGRQPCGRGARQLLCSAAVPGGQQLPACMLGWRTVQRERIYPPCGEVPALAAPQSSGPREGKALGGWLVN